MPRDQTNCFFIVDAIGGGQIKPCTQWFFEGFFKSEAIGIKTVSIFLREYETESDEAPQFSREADALREAKERQQRIARTGLLWVSLQQHRFECLFQQTARCFIQRVLRL